MAHALRLLTQKLYNQPHLMEAKSFEAIMSYLDHRNSGQAVLQDSEDEVSKKSQLMYNPDTKVGMLSVEGPLTYKPVTMMGFDCGGANYQAMKADMDALAEQGMKTLVLNVDSGGGEAYQVFETAQYIRDVANANGIQILSYIDGMSASAAYALTSISDEIVVNPQAEVGSIGVVVRLMNDSKALEKEGYERTFVYAGGSKVPFAKDGSFREDFISDIQSKVDTLYESFTEFVAEHRNISVETVRSTEAKTFLPKEALSLGLADAVMTHEEFYSHLADVAQKENNMLKLKSKMFNMSQDSVSEVEMKELELAKEQLSEAQALLSAKDVELQAALEDAVTLKASFDTQAAELAGVKEQLAAFQAEKEAAELAAKQAVAQARLEKLTAAVGTEKASELSAKFEGADDALFEAMVGALEFASIGEKKSALFTEMGTAEAGVKVETNPSMEEALAAAIKKQYKTK